MGFGKSFRVRIQPHPIPLLEIMSPACALGHQACQEGHRNLNSDAPKLFRDLRNTSADGNLPKRIKQCARTLLMITEYLRLLNVSF